MGFAHGSAGAANVCPYSGCQIHKETQILSDDASYYKNVHLFFKGHDKVAHSRGEIHTNTIEGFFSIFKRGMKGVYQHCSEQHLHRYLAEFDFRYNNRKVDDMSRTTNALEGIVGKRLIYRDS